MKRKNNHKYPAVNVYSGKAVSLVDPWYAIPRQGSRLALGNVVELCDMYAIPVFTDENDPLTTYIRSYESYHHVMRCNSGHVLSVSYLSLPRLVLACRNNSLLAGLVFATPLTVSEG